MLKINRNCNLQHVNQTEDVAPDNMTVTEGLKRFSLR